MAGSSTRSTASFPLALCIRVVTDQLLGRAVDVPVSYSQPTTNYSLTLDDNGNRAPQLLIDESLQ